MTMIEILMCPTSLGLSLHVTVLSRWQADRPNFQHERNWIVATLHLAMQKILFFSSERSGNSSTSLIVRKNWNIIQGKFYSAVIFCKEKTCKAWSKEPKHIRAQNVFPRKWTCCVPGLVHEEMEEIRKNLILMRTGSQKCKLFTAGRHTEKSSCDKTISVRLGVSEVRGSRFLVVAVCCLYKLKRARVVRPLRIPAHWRKTFERSIGGTILEVKTDYKITSFLLDIHLTIVQLWIVRGEAIVTSG